MNPACYVAGVTDANPYETTTSGSEPEMLPADVAFRLPRLQRVFYFLAVMHFIGLGLAVPMLLEAGGLVLVFVAGVQLFLVIVHVVLAQMAKAKPLGAIGIAIAVFGLTNLVAAVADPSSLLSGIFGKMLSVAALYFAYGEAKALFRALKASRRVA